MVSAQSSLKDPGSSMLAQNAKEHHPGECPCLPGACEGKFGKWVVRLNWTGGRTPHCSASERESLDTATGEEEILGWPLGCSTGAGREYFSQMYIPSPSSNLTQASLSI